MKSNIRIKFGHEYVTPLKILFESNELNYEHGDGNCEWTNLDNPLLEFEIYEAGKYKKIDII